MTPASPINKTTDDSRTAAAPVFFGKDQPLHCGPARDDEKGKPYATSIKIDGLPEITQALNVAAEFIERSPHLCVGLEQLINVGSLIKLEYLPTNAGEFRFSAKLTEAGDDFLAALRARQANGLITQNIHGSAPGVSGVDQVSVGGDTSAGALFSTDFASAGQQP